MQFVSFERLCVFFLEMLEGICDLFNLSLFAISLLYWNNYLKNRLSSTIIDF